MGRRRVLVMVLGGLAAILLLVVGGLALLLLTIDFRPLVERYASSSLERRVSVGGLRIAWGTKPRIELRDLRVANSAWGSAPDMVRIAALSAELDSWSLLRGILRFEKLDLERPEVVLEREAGGGRVNWHFPGSGAHAHGGLAIVPRDRSQFPVLIDMALRDGLLIYRAPPSRDLRLDFHALAIRSADADQPVNLVMDGAYNDVPVALHGETQSFAILRQAALPFGAALTVTSETAKLDFKGTITEPLDFEGVKGQLTVAAGKLSDVTTFAGAPFGAGIPLEIAGSFTKQGVHWQLQQAGGKLGPSAFDATLALDEGGHGQPDTVAMNIAFAELDLQRLIATGNTAEPIDLTLDPNPGTNFDATLSAKRLDYGAMRFGDVALHGSSKPSQFVLSDLAFSFAGGRLKATGAADSAGDATRFSLKLDLTGADVGEVARLLGASAGQIAGQASGQAILATTARKTDDLLSRSRGQAVVAMAGGRVARSLVEQASTDIRTLFRKGDGVVPITCLLGEIELTNGLATIGPLRLRTPDTTVLGAGRVDLMRRLFQIDISSEGGTSLFALNVPVRIAGDFSHYSVQPLIGSGAAAPARGKTDLSNRVAPELRDLVQHSACQ